MGGLHPVVAIYATFLNRAFDQVLMDVALHRCGVTFVLDRAGVTGDDGASHNGMWDMSILQVVPGPAARRAARRRPAARAARARPSQVDDAPTVVRFPKGPPPADIEAVGRAGGCDVLVRNGAKDVLDRRRRLDGRRPRVEVAERLVAQGIGVTVVDPRWVKPVDPALRRPGPRAPAGGQHRGQRPGRRLRRGAAADAQRRAASTRRSALHGIPQEFLDHAKRARDPRADRAHRRRPSPAASSRTSPLCADDPAARAARRSPSEPRLHGRRTATNDRSRRSSPTAVSRPT